MAKNEEFAIVGSEYKSVEVSQSFRDELTSVIASADGFLGWPASVGEDERQVLILREFSDDEGTLHSVGVIFVQPEDED